MKINLIHFAWIAVFLLSTCCNSRNMNQSDSQGGTSGQDSGSTAKSNEGLDSLALPVAPENYFEKTITEINQVIKNEQELIDSLTAIISSAETDTSSQIVDLKAQVDGRKSALTKLESDLEELHEKNSKFSTEGIEAFRSKSKEGRLFSGYLIDPTKVTLTMIWRDQENVPYGNFTNFEQALTNDQVLLFAVNGGMYQPDQSPQGLYIESGQLLQQLDTAKDKPGNFYLQPNGVFLITEALVPHVLRSDDFNAFADSTEVQYATQSGPMLLIDGEINPKFGEASNNFHIRNGVGVMSDNRVVFIISDERVRFYELAEEFLKLGCQNALYLDGAISQAFQPMLGQESRGGGFGVMIAALKEPEE